MSGSVGVGGGEGGGGGVLNVTPLFGVSASSPHGYLLRCDDYTLLLDCGWSHSFSTEGFDALSGVLSEVDAVLLSHSSLRHVGALPYLRRWCGLRCPVYATLPIHSMGAMTLYDVHQQEVQGVRRRLDDGSEEELFTLDDVDAAFDAVHTLKYSEEWPLPPKLAGSAGGGGSGGGAAGGGSGRLRISPHQSGHTVGGCVWRILRDSEVLLYAVDYLHQKERHLDSGVLEAFTRPSLLLMDCATLSASPLWAPSPLNAAVTRKAREGRLKEEARAAVKAGGVCLLPCDSSGRVLELLLFLHQEWSVDAELKHVPLIFASPQADATVDFASASIEWLSESSQRYLDKEGVNPFSLRLLHKVRDLESVAQLTRHFTRPAVVLATSASLDPPSLSFRLLEAIAPLPHCRVVLTHDVEEGSVGHQLLQQRAAALTHGTAAPPFHVSYQRAVAVPLEGEELRAFVSLQKLREEQRELESRTTAMEEEEEEDEDEEEGTGGGDDARAQPPVNGSGSTPVGASASQSSAPSTSALSGLHSPFYVFPFQEAKRTVDAFGELGLQGFLDAGKAAAAAAAPQTRGGAADAARMEGVEGSRGAAAELSSAQPPASAGASSAKAAPLTASPSAPRQPPSRIRYEAATLSLRCRVAVEDFRGLSDGKSWRLMLQAVKPRKLVLVHGSEEDKAELKRFAVERKLTQQQPQPADEAAVEAWPAGEAAAAVPATARSAVPRTPQSVFVPSTRECVDISAEVSLRLALASSLLPRLRFARVDEYEVAYTEASVHTDPLQPMATAQLRPLHAEGGRREKRKKDALAPSTHPSVFLGPSRLADLRASLSAAGLDCEFQGGAVLVAAAGTLRVRKPSPSVITLQGIVSDAYYTTQQLLYALYEQV